MSEPPAWFVEIMGEIHRDNHQAQVRSWPWWARLGHRLRPCPACKIWRADRALAGEKPK